MVPESEAHDIRLLEGSMEISCINAVVLPLLNSWIWLPSEVLNKRMRVPFCEHVARIEPSCDNFNAAIEDV